MLVVASVVSLFAQQSADIRGLRFASVLPSFLTEGTKEGREEGRESNPQVMSTNGRDWIGCAQLVQIYVCTYTDMNAKWGTEQCRRTFASAFFFVGVNFRDSEISMLSKQQF